MAGSPELPGDDRRPCRLPSACFCSSNAKSGKNEEESIYQNLSDEYADFLRLVLEHADLQLRSKPRTEALSAEQEESAACCCSIC